MGSVTQNESLSRRKVAYISSLGTKQLQQRNPYIIAAWSIAFPGMGQILLSKYIIGFLLFIWEVLINYKAHINLLIFYSFIGDFEKAKQVVDIRWMSLYIPMYIFSIWDSYRTTIDINHKYILAVREDAKVESFKMDSFGINYLDKRIPWVSVIWSLLVPGAGQIYIHRIIPAAFLTFWWVTICIKSGFLPAFHYTLLGDFLHAKAVIDIQWVLNIPSVYLFAMYDAYSNTVDNNNLFEYEQSQFLRREYQRKDLKLLFKKTVRGDKMHIISTFEYSIYLELAISELEALGIKKENILAVPIDKRDEKRRLFDSIHSSDGVSLFDLPSILAVIFGVFGGIYGFILIWGPLIWGLIGILAGSLVGLGIKLFTTRKAEEKGNDKRGTEVVLIIECEENKLENAKDILWKNNALGISKLR